MKEHVFRLKGGKDLKEGIKEYVKEHNINAGIIISCVGCVKEAHIRLAGAKDFLHKKADFEIVSITGTVSINGIHVHLSLSDKKGRTIGGHLADGCIVGTTAEVCILELDRYTFDRVQDKETGYKELVVKYI